MTTHRRGGKHPQPTALVKLRGTVRPSRLAKRAKEPKPIGDLTDEAPEYFSPGERDQWRYVMTHCPRGVIKRLDRATLIAWCEAAERHKSLMLQIRKDNERDPEHAYLMPTKEGWRLSPLVNALDKTVMEMLRLAQELGFTPAARPRIHAEPDADEAKPEDPWSGLRLIDGGKPN